MLLWGTAQEQAQLKQILLGLVKGIVWNACIHAIENHHIYAFCTP